MTHIIQLGGTVEPGLFDTLEYPTRFCIPLKLAISIHVFYPELFDTGLFDTPAYSTPIPIPFMKKYIVFTPVYSTVVLNQKLVQSNEL